MDERNNMEREIVNKVAQSSLVTIDLEELHESGERVQYDIKDNLYKGLILREKDFRNFIKSNDWAIYKDKHVAIYCSADAIVPTWAYMLLTAKLEPIVSTVVFGDLSHLEEELFRGNISKIDFQDYQGMKVVIKGCSKIAVPVSMYVEITRLLRPFASSIMYGEPCSTVPIYKMPRQKV